MDLVPAFSPEEDSPPRGAYAADLFAHAYLMRQHEPLAADWQRRKQQADAMTPRQLDYQQWFEQAYRDDIGIGIEHREQLKLAIVAAIQDGCRISVGDVLASLDS